MKGTKKIIWLSEIVAPVKVFEDVEIDEEQSKEVFQMRFVGNDTWISLKFPSKNDYMKFLDSDEKTCEAIIKTIMQGLEDNLIAEEKDIFLAKSLLYDLGLYVGKHRKEKRINVYLFTKGSEKEWGYDEIEKNILLINTKNGNKEG